MIYYKFMLRSNIKRQNILVQRPSFIHLFKLLKLRNVHYQFTVVRSQTDNVTPYVYLLQQKIEHLLILPQARRTCHRQCYPYISVFIQLKEHLLLLPQAKRN